MSEDKKLIERIEDTFYSDLGKEIKKFQTITLYEDGIQDVRKLLDLYQQEKEKNKELTEIKQQKLSKYLHENLWICKDLSENYIHKQKIKEKIESIENMFEVCDEEVNYRLKIEDKAKIEVLKELLEEE